jgi:hypothetical protein
VARKLLYVTVESITVATTGEPLNVNDKSVTHALMAILIYPRSGAPTVTSALPIQELARGTTTLSSPSFFSNGLFKEEVQDSTLMNIKVMNRQGEGKIDKFFLKFFSTILGVGLGALAGGLGAVLGAISGIAIDALKGGIQGAGNDEVIAIGETNNIPIDILRIGPAPVTQSYPLILKQEVEKRYIDPQTNQPATLRISPGVNGSINLRMWTEDL